MKLPSAPLVVTVHDHRILERPESSLSQSGQTGWARSNDGGVVLHTDPVGVDPIAWRVIDGALHLARYAHTLAALPPRASVDLATLRLISRIEYPEGAPSCFTGVGRAPAGTEVRFTSDAKAGAPQGWWQLPPEPAAASPVDLWRALVEQCSSLLGRSGDAAIFLSGGLDSAAVAAAAATAARENGLRPPLLLSVTYPGFSCDESPWQQMVAAHLELPLVQADATRLEFWPAARDAVARGIPTGDLQSAATAPLLLRAGEEGRNLVLMGLGGDALFSGDGSELGLYRRGNLPAAYRFFRDWGVASGQSAPTLWYRRGLRRNLLGHPFGSAREIAAAGSANRSGLRRALSHPAHGWRTEMIEGTISGPAPTIGCPLYGQMFLETFAKVPALELARGPGYKGRLRRIISPHLPDAVTRPRPKANFNDFHPSWIGRERRSMTSRYRALHAAVPDAVGLRPEIDSLLAETAPPIGLLPAWFSLCVAEFFAAWNA